MKKCKYVDTPYNDCRMCEPAMELSGEAAERFIEALEEIERKAKES